MNAFNSGPLDTAEQRERLIAPLEIICLPAALDGSALWAKPHPMHGSKNIESDVDAIVLWVKEQKGTSMREQCRRAIEKLLLWCVVERGHCLAEFSADEVRLYCEFLITVEPRQRWMAAGARMARVAQGWRPFRAVTPAAAVRMQLILCRMYLNWSGPSGLYMPGSPLGAISSLLGDSNSTYYKSAYQLPVPRLSIEGWVALRQFFPERNKNFINLQLHVAFQLLFYGGIAIRHALMLRRSDFNAHHLADHSIGAWEFPSGNRRGSTVFSVGPLTESLTQLFRHSDLDFLDLNSSGRLFSIRDDRMRRILKLAKAAVGLHLQTLGLQDACIAASNLTLAQIRGGVITEAERNGQDVDLGAVFSWTYLSAYPLIAQYLDHVSLSDHATRLKSALAMSVWISQTELASAARLADLQSQRGRVASNNSRGISSPGLNP